MVVDDPRTRRELEAVAYGRAVTPTDDAAVARAMQALRELDDRAASATPEPVTVEVVDDPLRMSHDAQSRAITRSLRRFWVVPVVIASLGLGAVGGAVATRAVLGQVTVPPGSGSWRDTTIANSATPQPPSDADGSSAEDWLSQPRRQIDSFPDEPGLVAFGVDPYSTHVVKTDGMTHVWVARGSNRGLCLVMMAMTDGSFQVRCTPPELFPDWGVTAEAEDGTTAHWSTDGVTLSEPVAGTMG
jgi:hypothetical protein